MYITLNNDGVNTKNNKNKNNNNSNSVSLCDIPVWSEVVPEQLLPVSQDPPCQLDSSFADQRANHRACQLWTGGEEPQGN